MKKNFYINLNDYDKDFLIDKGSFGEVFLIKRKDKPDDVYAAKISFNEITEDSKGSIDLKREINIISKISHPCIIKFIGFSPKNFENQHKPVIVTEYLKNGSLDKLLDLSMKGIAPDEWDDTHKLITLYGIASGMAFLHANNICHRDLKPANVLLDEYLHPKICDFGLSKENGSIVESGFKGTLLYSSPEIILENDYTPAGDVYAFAIIAYQIIMNEMPFKNEKPFSLQLKITRGERPKFNSYIPDSYRELIESCWSDDVIGRPTFDEILNALKTDSGFITDMVDEVEFFNYVDFIDNNKAFYNPGLPISIFDIENDKEDEEIEKIVVDWQEEKAPSGFPQNIYSDLSKKNKKLVKKALIDDDSLSQFNIGTNLLFSRYGFPKKPELGMKYLKMAADSNNIKAVKFYCKRLINGSKKDLNEARKILKEHIDDDSNDDNYADPEIYYLYGLLYIKEKNIKEAKKYLLKTRKSDLADPMYELGMIYYNEKDFINARKYFDKAKKRGSMKKTPEIPESTEETYQRAMNYINGENGCRVDYRKAISILKISAAKDHLNSIKELGKIFYKGNKSQKIPKKYNEAFVYFKKAAKMNDLFSIKKVGYMYFNGLGTNKDDKLAAYYYKLASDRGDIRAIINYSQLLIIGDDSDRNINEARRYLKIGAEQGDEECINELQKLDQIEESANDDEIYQHAFNLEKGINGETRNLEQAREYYQMSADAGEVKGMLNYARFLQNGIGGPPDNVKATKYYKKAADKNDKDGIFTYGLMLEHGNGIKKDLDLAIKYYKRAADRGHVKAMVNYARWAQNKNNDLNEALKYYKMAYKLNPNDEAAANGITIVSKYLKRQENQEKYENDDKIDNDDDDEIDNDDDDDISNDDSDDSDNDMFTKHIYRRGGNSSRGRYANKSKSSGSFRGGGGNINKSGSMHNRNPRGGRGRGRRGRHNVFN